MFTKFLPDTRFPAIFRHRFRTPWYIYHPGRFAHNKMDNSPPLSPVQSSSPPSSPALVSSPTVLSSPDRSSSSEATLCNSSQRSGSSDSSSITMNTESHSSHLSILKNGQPTSPEVKESPFLRHDKMSTSRISRKHIPYPPNPAPLELRYAARITRSKFQPEFSLEATQKVCHIYF